MPVATHSALMRRVIASVGLLMAVFCAAPAVAKDDISDYFKMYYGQQIVSGAFQGPLDFLHDAAAAHTGAEQVLKPSASRAVTIDRRNGYLRIDDSSNTDQILTMAIYLKADGSPLLLVGSSNCADGCTFAVQFFLASAEHLQAVALDAVVPAIGPAQFIKPGHAVPKALASLTPSINYIPARVGTTLTLTPWYGYEVEEQMKSATRAAIRNIMLTWDGKQGRFVQAPGGS